MGETVKELFTRLANSNSSSEEDSRMMESVLHKMGFPRARVVVGVVYLEGQGTMNSPPTSIHSVAKMILKASEKQIKKVTPVQAYQKSDGSVVKSHYKKVKVSSKSMMEKRRKELLRKAKLNYDEVNKYGEIPFDAINHLSDDEGKEFMKLEYDLGYSDFNPNEGN